ncbi:hypothetical protein E2C01_077316 [Portunus trituberculatus]|uniref:Uncharacterized protein n=1 Tax=Portunus trituberculatus TaxID=210409 RepID=A0A5B7IB56_PORTR|nr:hypothetical protein [Portunus trituberculatus]
MSSSTSAVLLQTSPMITGRGGDGGGRHGCGGGGDATLASIMINSVITLAASDFISRAPQAKVCRQQIPD